MLKKSLFSLALAALCSAVVIAEDQKRDQTSQGQQPSSEQAQRASDAQPAAARDEADMDPTQAFVKEAYMSNLFEVKAGEMAAQKAQDDKIKQFARMMIEDHKKANQRLKQIAQSQSLQLSEQLDPIHQAKLDKIAKCASADLGRKYVNGQVAAHWMTVLEFRHQSQAAENAQVKEYAMQTLPKLEQHLTQVTKLAEQQIGGSAAQPASARQPAEAVRDAAKTADRATNAAGGTSSETSGATDSQSGTGADTAGQSDRAGQSDADQSGARQAK